MAVLQVNRTSGEIVPASLPALTQVKQQLVSQVARSALKDVAVTVALFTIGSVVFGFPPLGVGLWVVVAIVLAMGIILRCGAGYARYQAETIRRNPTQNAETKKEIERLLALEKFLERIRMTLYGVFASIVIPTTVSAVAATVLFNNPAPMMFNFSFPSFGINSLWNLLDFDPSNGITAFGQLFGDVTFCQGLVSSVGTATSLLLSLVGSGASKRLEKRHPEWSQLAKIVAFVSLIHLVISIVSAFISPLIMNLLSPDGDAALWSMMDLLNMIGSDPTTIDFIGFPLLAQSALVALSVCIYRKLTSQKSIA